MFEVRFALYEINIFEAKAEVLSKLKGDNDPLISISDFEFSIDAKLVAERLFNEIFSTDIFLISF